MHGLRGELSFIVLPYPSAPQIVLVETTHKRIVNQAYQKARFVGNMDCGKPKMNTVMHRDIYVNSMATKSMSLFACASLTYGVSCSFFIYIHKQQYISIYQ